jgi:hypothetical protein
MAPGSGLQWASKNNSVSPWACRAANCRVGETPCRLRCRATQTEGELLFQFGDRAVGRGVVADHDLAVHAQRAFQAGADRVQQRLALVVRGDQNTGTRGNLSSKKWGHENLFSNTHSIMPASVLSARSVIEPIALAAKREKRNLAVTPTEFSQWPEKSC